jgi:hypothetical protein
MGKKSCPMLAATAHPADPIHLTVARVPASLAALSLHSDPHIVTEAAFPKETSVTIRSPWIICLLALPLAVAAVGWGLRTQGVAAEQAPPAGAAPPSATPEKPERRLDVELRTFMRRKLDASSKILEGLAVEDMALIKEGARQLDELSSAEKWRVSADPLYRQHSAEFREVVQQLIKASDERNLDRAALKWMDATMSCIECHRCVRGMHIVTAAR